MVKSVDRGGLGAYGLRIVGLSAAAATMQPLDPASPRLRVQASQVGPTAGMPSQVSATAADLRLAGGVRLRMRRGEEVIRFAAPAPLSAQELLHPYLAPAAALAHIWAGREALHAGAFVAGGRAVLLLAGKEEGKSTTLAHLARRHGLGVIADDLAIVADGSVLAGPRCLDLRVASPLEPRGPSDGELVRCSERLRIGLPPSPPRMQIGAIVILRWGPDLDLRVAAPDERLRELLAQRMYGARVEADHAALLELSALPTLVLARPRGRAGLSAAGDALAGYRF